MDKENKYYNKIESLIKKHKKYSGLEPIIEDIINDVLLHSEAIICNINNESVIDAYLEKVVSTSIITVPKKMNFNKESKCRNISLNNVNDNKKINTLVDSMINSSKVEISKNDISKTVELDEISQDSIENIAVEETEMLDNDKFELIETEVEDNEKLSEASNNSDFTEISENAPDVQKNDLDDSISVSSEDIFEDGYINIEEASETTNTTPAAAAEEEEEEEEENDDENRHNDIIINNDKTINEITNSNIEDILNTDGASDLNELDNFIEATNSSDEITEAEDIFNIEAYEENVDLETQNLQEEQIDYLETDDNIQYNIELEEPIDTDINFEEIPEQNISEEFSLGNEHAYSSQINADDNLYLSEELIPNNENELNDDNITTENIEEKISQVDYSKFEYKIKPENEIHQNSNIGYLTDNLQELANRTPDSPILEVCNLKYKENKTISEIALELNISEKEVIEILNEIVEII